MKNLILTFCALLILTAGFSQTANYTASSTTDFVGAFTVHDRTIVWSMYDTLSGANDTLIISFPSTPLYQYSQACLGATWLATGTTSSSSVVLQGRNTAYETWATVSSAAYSAEVTTTYDSDPVPYLNYRLMAVSAANIAHLRTSLVLKRL